MSDLIKYFVRCKACGHEMDSYVAPEELNDGSEKCPECGDRGIWKAVQEPVKEEEA